MPDHPVVFARQNFVLMVTEEHGREVAFGGFSEASSLPRKIQGLNKAGDVTLKRGVVRSQALFDWLRGARRIRDAVLMQRDDAGAIAGSWELGRSRVKKYVGPALNAKGTDVAIEELVLGYESLEWRPPK